MSVRTWTFLLAAAMALTTIPARDAAAAQFGRGRVPEIWQPDRGTDDYGAGYREGLRQGEADARDGRRFSTGSSTSRSRYGVGFADGYRAGYDSQHALAPLRPRNTDARAVAYQRPSRNHQEPAFAAGYEDGYARGLTDGTNGHRYDPVRHEDYRDAGRGYRESYGSRDAYRTNYRAGFRQGYEDGYRLGARNRG